MVPCRLHGSLSRAAAVDEAQTGRDRKTQREGTIEKELLDLMNWQCMTRRQRTQL